MGLIQAMKNLVYDLFTRSGIFFIILPILKPLMTKLAINQAKGNANYKITDEKGSSIKCCKVGDKMFPPFGEKQIKSVKSLRIRHDDVLLCGYPKTGAHWMHEILHMLVTGKAETTKHGKELGGMIDGLPAIVMDSLPSPRVLNSHLLYEDLPDQVKEKKIKIVLTCRNPKDTVVSFYNHHRSMQLLYEYKGEFNDYFKLFMSGEIDYGSYFDFVLSWDEMLKTCKDNPILLVPFEDIKADPIATVKKLAAFLEIDVSDSFVQELVDACSFNALKEKNKNDPILKSIYRKGVVGDWKNWLTPEQSAQIDKVWRERMMGCTYQPGL